MEFLIVLMTTIAMCLAMPQHYGYHGPPAPIGHDGRVLDTPEVAQAKAAHLAAFAHAASRTSYSVPSFGNSGHYGQNIVQGHVGFSQPVAYSARTYHDGHGYLGPSAPLDHEGRVVDTPEVAHAKAAHFAAYSNAISNVAHAPLTTSQNYVDAYGGSYRQGYQGPAAPLSHDGRVVDTPEVAQARAAHLAAYSNAIHARPHSNYGHY